MNYTNEYESAQNKFVTIRSIRGSRGSFLLIASEMLPRARVPMPD